MSGLFAIYLSRLKRPQNSLAAALPLPVQALALPPSLAPLEAERKKLSEDLRRLALGLGGQQPKNSR